MKFIESGRATGPGTWIKLSTAPTWRSWSSTAFESICLKHTAEIKHALGISGVYIEESIWRFVAPKNQSGTQIDLLLDRNDYCISICEMKFSTSQFTIDKAYAAELQNKVDVFRQETNTKKSLFVVLVTSFGTKDSSYKISLAQNEVTLKYLFG